MSDIFNWKSFLYNIRSKATIPVIGNDLSIIKLKRSSLTKYENYSHFIEAGVVTDEFLLINLYKYLSILLWEIFGTGEVMAPPTINNVLLNLQKVGVTENDINNVLQNEIHNLTDEQIVLEPYLNLVRMNCFETFVTVNIDGFLERAFAIENKLVNKSRNFSIPVLAVDYNQKIDTALPRIFNLMGNIDASNTALTDEQSLEYIYMLHNESDSVVKELFDSIKQKNILLIGSSFPDWFMRFFLRIISKERFKTGVKTKYVACDNTLDDSELIRFLENNATKIIPINKGSEHSATNNSYKNSSEFIKEMFTQHKGAPEENAAEIKYKEEVFISYSRDDKDLAQRIKNEFVKNGVNVFFDEDNLKTGDRFNSLIKNHIRDCNYFVALISRNAIEDTSRYVYEKEWRSAIVLNSFKEVSYIRPYIIDDTDPTDSRIPEEIRGININKIKGEGEISNTIRKFILDNNLTPVLG